MRALLQRVSEASVTVNGKISGEIGTGLVVFLGVGLKDTRSHADQLARKIVQLRIFADVEAKMNRSLLDVGGELLVVSQFTLYADTRKGNRPSYSTAAGKETAQELYEYFIEQCRAAGARVSTGVFQAHMEVRLTNDGPVTILCETES